MNRPGNHPGGGNGALIRAQLVDGFMQAGATLASAQAIADTAMRATEAAIASAYQLCNTLPAADAFSALLTCMQLLEDQAARHYREAHAEFAAMPDTREVEVAVGGRLQ